MTAGQFANRLAEYATSVEYQDLDDETVHNTKIRILDAYACALASLSEPPVRTLLDLAAEKTAEESVRVLGTEIEAPLDFAIFVNATLIRYLDWNDTYISVGAAHPSCNIGPILAIADRFGSSGKDIISAVIVAYQLQCTLADTVSLRDNGLDHTNFGAIGSTLAIGKLRGLSEGELADAVSMVVAGNLGLRGSREGSLTEWKGAAFGNAARNSVHYCELAQAGFQGPKNIFTGDYGLQRLLDGDGMSVPNFQGQYKINETYIKKYPVCYHTVSALDCVFDILAHHNIDPAAVRGIEVEASQWAVAATADRSKWDPADRNTADHSMPYFVARSVLDGRLSMEQLTPEKYEGADAAKMMEKISIDEKPGYTERHGSPHGEFHTKVSIQTPEKTYDSHVTYPRGHPENPMNEGDWDEKLQTASSGKLSEVTLQRTKETILDLEREQSIRGIFPAVI